MEIVSPSFQTATSETFQKGSLSWTLMVDERSDGARLVDAHGV